MASFLGSAALSIFANAIFYTDLTPAGLIAEKYIAPTLLVVSFACVVLAGIMIYQRSRLWRDIRRESETVP
jgi:hypothetical protein